MSVTKHSEYTNRYDLVIIDSGIIFKSNSNSSSKHLIVAFKRLWKERVMASLT
jgi:RecA-family ATPase